jgi:branched-chain amino acid transport system permease protein
MGQSLSASRLASSGATLAALRPLVALVASLALAVLLSRLLGYYGLYLLTLVEVFGVVATGLTLFMGYTGQLSIGHAAFFGLGAYSAANLSKFGAPFPLASLGGAVAAAALGYGVGFVALRLRGFYLAVVTLAVGLIATQVFKNFDAFTGGVSGMGGIPRAAIGALQLDSPSRYFLATTVALIAVVTLSWAIVKSPTGRVMRAIAANELAAQSVGVDTQGIKIHVFALSTFYAGLAGGLYADLVHFITPDHFSFGLSVQLLTMAIIGGPRNVFGGLIGAALIVLAGEELQSVPEWQPILYGLLLMGAAMYMPGGVAGLTALVRGASVHWRKAAGR